jgi:putative flippase GtrA
MNQFLKFACVGVANTLMDLGVLNLLLAIFGINGNGKGYLACKATSFSIAVINSYFLNKLWVFRAGDIGNPYGRAAAFGLVSAMGLIVNTAVSGLALSIFMNLMPDAIPTILTNGAALMGTAAVLVFNFFSYKLVVFRTTKLNYNQTS